VKKILNVCAVLSVVSLLSLYDAKNAKAEPVKVGTVDLQKALQEVKRGKTAKSQLEKSYEEKKKKIDADQAAIKKDSEGFQKKAAALSAKARNDEGLKIQERMTKWQQLVQQSQVEIQGKEAELTKPILEGLRTLVPEISRRRKLDLVMESNAGGILYAVDKTDLTEELIKLFDEKNP
jgi:outer membrane protein